MPDEQRTKDPSTTSVNYAIMAPVWQKIDTLLAGTSAMRSAGETYLPRHENERTQRYTDRLESTTLRNTTSLTLDSWVGRPFSDAVVVGEDVPPALVEDLDDIDLQGHDVTTFARDWFKWGLAKAFAHVLVDHPIPTGDPEERTLADDRAENLRPYWSFIRPENLIFAASQVVGGREILVHARILETETVQVGFSEGEIVRIRVFDRGVFMNEAGDPEVGVFFSTWIQQTDAKDGTRKWVIETPQTKMDIDEIPLVTFYADRQGLLLGKPPLEDLVDLNIEHWQSSSDQRSILTMGRFPILAVNGVDDEESQVVVGPKQILTTPTPGSRWYYVEPTGKAIEAGEKDLKRLVDSMAEYGAEFLKKRPQGETATARALDAAEATSPLQDATNRFARALNKALALSAKWRKLEEGGTLSVSSDFGPEDFFPGDVDLLTKARGGRDLSRENYLVELKRRGALREDFDIEENDQQLEEEATTSLSGFAGTIGGDIDPQQGDGEDGDEE